MKFNEALLKLNVAVMKKHPEAAFYEAQGYLIPNDSIGCKVDGTIDKTKFRAVYRKPVNETVIATFTEDDKVNIEVVKEPWLEDVVTTPYVPLSVEQAIEILVKKYGVDGDRLEVDWKGKTIAFGDIKFSLNRRVSFYRVIE